MRILHTSDWHLGHMIYGYDRTEEQAAMLEAMCGIASEYKPDLFVLSGDVFHVSQPSAAVQTMFTNAVSALRHACPDMVIVITAGNHDSASRHEVFRTPWKTLGVHMTGNISKENIEDHVIELPGKGYVAAIPYCSDRNMPEGFYQSVLDHISERNQDNLPVIMTAHTTVSGCDTTGHEGMKELVVGGIDGLELSDLGTGYDYLALGHIHRPQYISGGEGRVRYSGPPLPVSFDEAYGHSVTIVDIASHGDRPKITCVEVENPCPMVTLPSEGFATWDEAKTLLSEFPADIKAYIRLNVEAEDYLQPDAFAVAQSLTDGKACRFCHINTRRKTVSGSVRKEMSIEEFKEESPVKIAERYAEDNGISFDEELHMMFDEVLKIIEEESREE